MRRIYAGRRQYFYSICASRFAGQMTLLSSEAGIQVVGHLRAGLNDIRIAEAAASRGINVSPLSKYYQKGAPIQGLVLGYAACDELQTEQGVKCLERAIAESL